MEMLYVDSDMGKKGHISKLKMGGHNWKSGERTSPFKIVEISERDLPGLVRIEGDIVQMERALYHFYRYINSKFVRRTVAECAKRKYKNG